MPQDRHSGERGGDLLDELQAFRGDVGGEEGEPRDVPARSGEAGYEAFAHGVLTVAHDDRDRTGGLLGGRAAEKRHELAAFHSITSSARASSVGGTSRPSAFAVVRLITRSNLVGCSTGMSAGFAPRKILSTNSPARRNRSV